jgi:hypothetical protein
MSDPAALNNPEENFDNMSVTEFEERLPDLVQSGQGKMTEDARFANFFAKNPDCAALVRDLEAIADAAKDLFPTEEEQGEEELDANDPMWKKIKDNMNITQGALDEPEGVLE